MVSVEWYLADMTIMAMPAGHLQKVMIQKLHYTANQDITWKVYSRHDDNNQACWTSAQWEIGKSEGRGFKTGPRIFNPMSSQTNDFKIDTCPSGLVPQLWSAASYLTKPLVRNSGSVNVTLLRHVPFAKCASNNYKATQTPPTHKWRE